MYIDKYTYLYKHTHLRVCVCMSYRNYMNTHTRKWVHEYIYISAYIRTYIHKY